MANKEIKIYETQHGNLSMLICVNGEERRIRFISHDGVRGYFLTKNKAMQKALEKDTRMGKKYQLQTTFGTPAQIEIPPLNSVEGIKTWQEARDYLRKSPFMIAGKLLTTPKRIQEQAAQIGLYFPLLTQ